MIEAYVLFPNALLSCLTTDMVAYTPQKKRMSREEYLRFALSFRGRSQNVESYREIQAYGTVEENYAELYQYRYVVINYPTPSGARKRAAKAVLERIIFVIRSRKWKIGEVRILSFGETPLRPVSP